MTVSLRKSGFLMGNTEALLIDVFRIDLSMRPALAARIQQLFRSKLPPGAHSKRGKPLRFNWSQISDLSLFVTLMDLGFTPSLLKALFAEGFYCQDDRGLEVERSQEGEDLFLLIKFRQLNNLRLPKAAAEDAPSFMVGDASHVLQFLDRGGTIVNLSKNQRALRDAVERLAPAHIPEATFARPTAEIQDS